MKNRWLSPLAIVVSFASQVYCFLPREERSALHTLSSPLSLSTSTSVEQPCFWKPKAAGSKWQERIHIRDLNVGQKLSGHVVADLLEGKTGPKVYFECGVGRTDKYGSWSITNGMLRLDRWSKISVSKKRAQRLRKKAEVELFVSRLQPECARFEVVRTEEEVEKYLDVPNKISLSSLKEGQEVTGEVVKLCSYGAFVDVGANRLGLLHIQKVADLYNKYIAKEEGLIKAGLEVGAGVRLTIKSNHKKRLELDFTQDVKSESEDEQRHQKQKLVEIQISPVTSNEIMEEDELAEWASFASQSNTVIQSVEEVVEDEEIEEVEEEDLVDEDDYDDYDEEKDIEDALGLGFY